MTWCRKTSIRTISGMAISIDVVTSSFYGSLRESLLETRVTVIGIACRALARANARVNRNLP